MNITILSNRDLASNLALNYLYQGLGGKHNLRVFLSAQVGSKKTKPKALTELSFIEQTLFNQLIFPALSSRGAPAKDRLLSFDDFQQMGVSVEDISSINCEQGQQTISDGNPDLIISIRFGLILKSPILAIPQYGVINLHSGKLPEYRGVMACFRAMQNAEETISTSLHYISDDSIDTGDGIATYTMPIDYQASYLTNLLNLYKGGVDSIIGAVQQIDQQGMLASQPHQGRDSYYSFPTEQELEDFFSKGYKLYDHQELIDFCGRYF